MMAKFDPDDLESLRSSVRGMLDRHSNPQAVREWVDEQPPVVPDKVWQELCNLGSTSLLVPPDFGGIGAGLAPTVIVLEEIGAHTTPVPYLSSAVLATVALTNGSSVAAQRRWLPQLAAGDAIGTVALGSAALGPPAPGHDRRFDLSAHRGTADSVVFEGEARFVPHGADADVVVAAAREVESGAPVVGAIALASANVVANRVDSIDRTHPVTHLALDGVKIESVDILGSGQAALDLIDSIIDFGAVALAADGLGVAKRALAMSVEYAKQRQQFGRAIGSFQAIKHKLADMFVLAAAVEAAVAASATAIDRDAGAARRRVAATGSFCRAAVSRITGDAMQIHGGIGFTWEHDCHLLLKRAKFNELFLTDSWEQQRRLLTAAIPTQS